MLPLVEKECCSISTPRPHKPPILNMLTQPALKSCDLTPAPSPEGKNDPNHETPAAGDRTYDTAPFPLFGEGPTSSAPQPGPLLSLSNGHPPAPNAQPGAQGATGRNHPRMRSRWAELARTRSAGPESREWGGETSNRSCACAGQHTARHVDEGAGASARKIPFREKGISGKLRLVSLTLSSFFLSLVLSHPYVIGLCPWLYYFLPCPQGYVVQFPIFYPITNRLYKRI